MFFLSCLWFLLVCTTNACIQRLYECHALSRSQWLWLKPPALNAQQRAEMGRVIYLMVEMPQQHSHTFRCKLVSRWRILITDNPEIAKVVCHRRAILCAAALGPGQCPRGTRKMLFAWCSTRYNALSLSRARISMWIFHALAPIIQVFMACLINARASVAPGRTLPIDPLHLNNTS